jgi:hypothetical protein
MTSLLAAVSWHPARPRSLEDSRQMPERDQAYLPEWLVAKELWRRRAVRGEA